MTHLLDQEVTGADVGAFHVSVVYDDDGQAANPRDWDNLGTLAGSSRHSTVYEEEYASAGEAWRATRESVGALLAFPIRVEDGYHGSNIYECDWDDADGIYYVPMSKVLEEWPGTLGERIKAARACLATELETLSAWCQGEVYGYVVTDDQGEEVDSCWGFVGEDSYAMEEGRAIAMHLEAQRWQRWANLPAWMQAAVLIAEDVSDDD